MAQLCRVGLNGLIVEALAAQFAHGTLYGFGVLSSFEPSHHLIELGTHVLARFITHPGPQG